MLVEDVKVAYLEPVPRDGTLSAAHRMLRSPSIRLHLGECVRSLEPQLTSERSLTSGAKSPTNCARFLLATSLSSSQPPIQHFLDNTLNKFDRANIFRK
jgi:hypothetical protein